MAVGGFLLDNLANTGTLTVSSEITGYPKAAVYDGMPARTTRTDGAGATETWRWDLGSAQAISAVAILNHNIPATATSIKIQWSSDNWAHVHAEETLTHHTKNIYKAFGAQVYQYVGIEIVLPGAAMMELGDIYLAQTKWQFSQDFGTPGYQRVVVIEKNVNLVGGQAFSEKISKRYRYVLPFRGVPTFERSNFGKVLEGDYCIFIPDFDEPECYHGSVIQTELANDINPQAGNSHQDNFNLEFTENAIGV